MYRKDFRNAPVTVLMDFASHQLNVRQNNMLVKYGITGKQAKVLFFIIRHRDMPINQKDIENFFMIRSSSITSIMGYLEESGFIRRYADTHDGRAKRIEVTNRGLDLHNIIVEIRDEHERIATGGLTAEERTLLRELMLKVVENISPGIE